MLNLEDPNNILLDLESIDLESSTHSMEKEKEELHCQLQELKLSLINNFLNKSIQTFNQFKHESADTKREKIDIFIREIKSQIKVFQSFCQKINLLSVVPSVGYCFNLEILNVVFGFLCGLVLGVLLTLFVIHFNVEK
jgi:hypothetical protein